MKTLLLLLSLLLALLVGPFAHAAQPAVDARGAGGEWGDASVAIERLQLELGEAAGVLQARWTLTLRNDAQEGEIEARIRLPLPDGAVINGYALDIGGVLVDGVLSEKERAETVYTSRVTQRIDPGIAERAADGRYQTRIYPVLPGETRKVRLSYAAPWPAGALDVPLDFGQLVEDLALDLNGVDVRGWPGGLSASGPRDNVRLSGALSLERPVLDAVTLTRHGNGELFLSSVLRPGESRPDRVLTGGRVAVLWDNSASRRADDVEPELAMLVRLLRRLSPRAVELVVGAETAERVETNGDVVGAIRALTPDGASDLGGMARAAPESDVCILFSDGRATAGEALTPPDCAVVAVRRNGGADHAALGWLASATDGVLITPELSER